MTTPRPMFGVGLWYPTSTYKATHFIRQDSTPGNFYTACGIQLQYVGDRSSADGRAAPRCPHCVDILPIPKRGAQ